MNTFRGGNDDFTFFAFSYSNLDWDKLLSGFCSAVTDTEAVQFIWIVGFVKALKRELQVMAELEALAWASLPLFQESLRLPVLT